MFYEKAFDKKFKTLNSVLKRYKLPFVVKLVKIILNNIWGNGYFNNRR